MLKKINIDTLDDETRKVITKQIELYGKNNN
jgi:hypothetical protein